MRIFMQVSNSTLQRFDFVSLSAEKQARIAKFEQRTGKELEVYKDEDGGIVTFGISNLQHKLTFSWSFPV